MRCDVQSNLRCTFDFFFFSFFLAPVLDPIHQLRASKDVAVSTRGTWAWPRTGLRASDGTPRNRTRTTARLSTYSRRCREPRTFAGTPAERSPSPGATQPIRSSGGNTATSRNAVRYLLLPSSSFSFKSRKPRYIIPLLCVTTSSTWHVALHSSSSLFRPFRSVGGRSDSAADGSHFYAGLCSPLGRRRFSLVTHLLALFAAVPAGL